MTALTKNEALPGESFLSVRDLKVHFPTSDGVVKAVDGLSFDLERGKTIGIVGESGSGKSGRARRSWVCTAAQRKVSGEILLDGDGLLHLTEVEMRALKGGGSP